MLTDNNGYEYVVVGSLPENWEADCGSDCLEPQEAPQASLRDLPLLQGSLATSRRGVRTRVLTPLFFSGSDG